MQQVSLVIAEPRTLVRQGLAALCCAAERLEVVGLASDIEEMLRVCKRTQPRVVLVSRRLLDDAPLERADPLARLRVHCPCAAVGVVTESDEGRGHLEREPMPELGGAPVTVALDIHIDSRELNRQLIAMAGGEGETSGLSSAAEHEIQESIHSEAPSLTERECAIVCLVAEGLCNKEIGQRLCITMNTVKNHVHHLLQKLDMADRTQLAVYAVQHGLSGPAPDI